MEKSKIIYTIDKSKMSFLSNGHTKILVSYSWSGPSGEGSSYHVIIDENKETKFERFIKWRKVTSLLDLRRKYERYLSKRKD